jgi:hypothetical protein
MIMIFSKTAPKRALKHPDQTEISRHSWKPVAFCPKNQDIAEGESGHAARINAD